MLSLQLIIILGLLFGLLVCCMVATQFAPGHLAVGENQAADWPEQTITSK
jgi:hypothetical protein